MQAFDCVCPPDNRYFPVFGQDCWVMPFFLCEPADLVGKVERLHKIL